MYVLHILYNTLFTKNQGLVCAEIWNSLHKYYWDSLQ